MNKKYYYDTESRTKVPLRLLIENAGMEMNEFGKIIGESGFHSFYETMPNHLETYENKEKAIEEISNKAKQRVLESFEILPIEIKNEIRFYRPWPAGILECYLPDYRPWPITGLAVWRAELVFDE